MPAGLSEPGAATTIRIRKPRRPRPRGRIPALSLIGLAAMAPAAAQEKRPGTHRHSPAPPWSDPDGILPPHPSGRTGVEVPVLIEVSERRGRGESDARPREALASRRRMDSKIAGTYRVRAGDSLWSIAADWLGTHDPARIARYWPRIHRASRSIIGADPNLILPNQVLIMPPEPGTSPNR